MNVSRRGFLGSILGTYVTTQLPWIAQTATIEPLPKGTGGYRSILVLNDGSQIKGPNLRNFNTDPGRLFEFVYEPLEIVKPIVVCENILVDPNGHMLARSPLSGGSQALFPGDRLNLSHKITLERSIRPLQEVTQYLPNKAMEDFLEKNLEPGLWEQVQHEYKLGSRRRIIKPR